MLGQDADAGALEGVPEVAGAIVVAGEEEPAGGGEGDGGDAAEDGLGDVLVQLAVCPEVEEPA